MFCPQMESQEDMQQHQVRVYLWFFKGIKPQEYTLIVQVEILSSHSPLIKNPTTITVLE